MDVVPVCECPSCHKLGLHYMSPGPSYPVYLNKRTEITEIPTGGVMLLETGEEKPTFALHYEYKFDTFERYTITRECWYCQHSFDQEWKDVAVE